jgi:ornithine cyclodeaminase
MHDNDILILKGAQVLDLLSGREGEIVGIVETAYKAHGRGDSSLPHSTFLRFPDDQKNRIIALPAYLGEEFGVAGIKWISSFPENISRGLDRASAVIILNSVKTGRPEAIIEGSIISAKRTAASAALAARSLQNGRPHTSAGLLGCGLINFEILRFLRETCPRLEEFRVFDLDAARAAQFRDKCRDSFGVRAEVAPDVESLFDGCQLVSMATTAATPHIKELTPRAQVNTILHVSLRDLAPELILACDNVVDDIDHVCRSQTSVHLAQQLTGDRSFIRCTLSDVLEGRAPSRRDDESVVVFSPFGLGVLDIALAKYVCERGVEASQGTFMSSFLPDAWAEVN